MRGGHPAVPPLSCTEVFVGLKVTVVGKRPTMLDFCDDEVVEALQYKLRDLAVTYRPAPE
jgi:pyruvate/2-oxoglutarate dehydrogenase complex dihydrolipoamide dehydrogenase (E3) component